MKSDKKKKEKECILVVDDAPDTLELIRRNLSLKGFSVITTTNVTDALRILESYRIDLVITDLKMPRVSGLDLIRHVRDNYRDKEIMLITGYPSLEGAVEAVKTGAEEYLTKPFTDKELFDAVERSLKKLQLRRTESMEIKDESSCFEGLIGESRAMQEVFNNIRKAAVTSATVLITGESGTGKELAARAIHYTSDRASYPFIAVNCSAIPEGLLESELFGYVKGAFTGADQSRAGFFQTADRGTIFLDEISETGLAMQVKLLRIIQEKEVFMLGSRKPRKVDVRIVASTNKNLQNAIKKGSFREDLFYRLNVISIEMPPLRERGNDVFILANRFKEKFAGEMGKPVPHFSDRVLQIFQNYDWPGNVRELENLIQQIIVMSDAETIDVPDLPRWMRFSIGKNTGVLRTLEEVEAEHIINVLQSVGGNKTEASKILGIDRKTLRLKLNKMESIRNR
ncbi:MAG: sigma-54-dependent Fis family transcriptional regulator [Spirochaetes bacterium]|nr:MAG: sigma-54-dependent Fis family transcriptional regulator [Spirochaetota bacterium]